MAVRDKLKKVYAKALVLLSCARTKLQPHNAASRLQLAEAYLQQSAWQDALDLGLEVLHTQPNTARAYQIIAAAYAGQDQRSKALSAISTAIQLNPQVAWFYQDLGKIYLSEEDFESAIAAFQQAIDCDDQVSWFHFHLGETLVKQGDWNSAIAPLRQAIKLNLMSAWSYYYLAEAHLNLEQVDEAIALYRKAIVTAPDIQYLHEALAYAQHLQNQEDRIQAFCQQTQNARSVNHKPFVLLMTPYLPYPPKSGAASRMFYEMKALHARSNLAVVSLSFSKSDFRVETNLAAWSQLSIVVNLGDRPSRVSMPSKTVYRYHSNRMTKILTALSAANFDLVVIDFVYMAQYRYLFPNAFTVLSEHNIESQILRRCAEIKPSKANLQDASELAKNDLEASQLEAFENQFWPQFALRMVVSQQDQKVLDRRAPGGNTIVVNNGINTEEIKPFPDNPIPRVLFMGTFHYYPNVEGAAYFIQEILPLVWQHNPEIECWLAGAEPSPQIYDLAQDSRIKIVANPEHMEDVAAQCCLTIVPLRIGSGTRIKILHSMAMGLPVVSTSLGCEGLNVVDNQHLLIRDCPIDFAAAIVHLIKDSVLRQKLRTEGRFLVEQQYDWKSVFDNAADRILAEWRTRSL